MEGTLIGIEVTELYAPHEHWLDWPLERFREWLAAIIDKKDRKAGRPERAPSLSRLDQLWLVIATDERMLTSELIEKHLGKIRLPKPTLFDSVFVLGPYEPRENAVMEGREHEPGNESASYTAFEVQWLAGPQYPGQAPGNRMRC